MTQKLYEVDVLDHVEIRLSDGKKLSAKMWMPRPTEVVMEGAAEGTTEGAAEAFPVVLEAIPYRKDDVCLIDDSDTCRNEDTCAFALTCAAAAIPKACSTTNIHHGNNSTSAK